MSSWRDSMRCSRSWSGPSKTGTATVYGASPTGSATASAASTGIGSMPSACVIGRLQGSKQRRIGVHGTPADESADAWRAPRVVHQVGGHALVMQVQVKGMPPGLRVASRQAAKDRRGEGLEQDSRDAVPEAHAMSLRAAVQERGG